MDNYQKKRKKTIQNTSKLKKCLKAPYMNDATLKRRVEHAGCLVENFETNSRMIEHVAFQNESDFPLQIPINS